MNLETASENVRTSDKAVKAAADIDIDVYDIDVKYIDVEHIDV